MRSKESVKILWNGLKVIGENEDDARDLFVHNLFKIWDEAIASGFDSPIFKYFYEYTDLTKRHNIPSLDDELEEILKLITNGSEK